MKLNLQCGNDIRHGYLNINLGPVGLPQELPEDTKFTVGDFRNLDPVIREPVDEIIFNPPLNLIPPDQLVNTLNHWYSKLNDKGSLKVHFLDIRRIAKGIHIDEITLQDAHTLIFGQHHQFNCLMDTPILKAIVSQMGFTVDIVSARQFTVSVELIKNA